MTHACRDCKAPILNWRSVLDNLCGLCLAKAKDEADRLREQFEGLLASGMSREDANEEMIRRLWAN